MCFYGVGAGIVISKGSYLGLKPMEALTIAAASFFGGTTIIVYGFCKQIDEQKKQDDEQARIKEVIKKLQR